MIDMNIKFYRQCANMTQGQLADKLCVTRQTVAKWENGDVSPNIDDCIKMASIWEISLEDLVEDSTARERGFAAPVGKHIFGLVTVGERGQIVIPKDARRVFKINGGDKLLMMGDEAQGIALVKVDNLDEWGRKMASWASDNGIGERGGSRTSVRGGVASNDGRAAKAEAAKTGAAKVRTAEIGAAKTGAAETRAAKARTAKARSVKKED